MIGHLGSQRFGKISLILESLELYIGNENIHSLDLSIPFESIRGLRSIVDFLLMGL